MSKDLGQIFTPQPIAEYMVKATLDKIKLTENTKILEPGVGKGIFIDELFKYLEKRNFTKQQIKKMLYAIDIDSKMINYCKIKWDINYYCGNTLLDDYFKDILDNGGFDVVIGNPPYVEARKIHIQNNILNFKTNYKSVRPNLYQYFIEKSLTILKNNGELLFINPLAFLSIDAGYGIRKFILENASINKIIDISNIKVFKSASTYTCILHICKKPHKIKDTIKINKCIDLKQLSVTSFEIQIADILKNSKLSILIDTETNILQKIENNTEPLDNYVDMSWGTSKTGYGKLKIKKNEYDNLPHKQQKEYKPIVQTADIKKYNIEWKGEYIPKNIFSDRIIGQFNLNKILIARVTKNIQCAYDDKYYYVGKSTVVTNISINKFYLIALLNSKLINFWYSKKYETTHMSGGYLRFDIPYLKQIPIKNINDTTKFENLVNEIMTLKQQDKDTQDLEDEIDSMVYELYGLSDEDVKIVEESMKI